MSDNSETNRTFDYDHKYAVDTITTFAGTKRMVPGTSDHVRQTLVRLPAFKNDPTVVAAVYSVDPHNPGNPMMLWNFTFNHQTPGSLFIKFSATSSPASGNNFEYLCSYTVIGELA